MDLFQSMRIFAAVVDENGITAAADKLGLSKALVSKTISLLEERLSTRLLNRTTRRIGLTEAGSEYLEHCRSMLEQNALAEAQLMSRSEAPSGLLKVSAPITFGLRFVAPLIPQFLADNPKVSVDLSLSDRFVDLMDDGIDLVVRVGEQAPDTAIVSRLSSTRHLLLAAPALIRRMGKPDSPSDLESWPVIEYTLRANPFSWRASRSQPKVAMRSNNGEVILNSAVAGQGLAYLPDFIAADAVERGDLQVMFPDETVEETPVVALYPSRRFLPLKTRAFIDVLRREMQKPYRPSA